MSAATTYMDSFLTKKPKDSIHVVKERMSNAVTLSNELADYFKERAQIEDAYAKSLSNASKRLYTKNLAVLGHFAPIWECLLKEFHQIAAYHSDMAHKIIEEVEKPLRNGTHPDDQNKLQQLESSILANDGKKTVKETFFKKSKSSSNIWQNEGAEYLKLQQKLDESRLTRMKTVVERFEKIQTEQLMKRVKMSNSTLSNAEAFDVQHDISDFCVERGKALSGSTPTSLDTSSTLSKSSKRLSTASSSVESHRSTNRFKSVFMKKKKNLDKLSDHDDHSSTYTGYSAVMEDEPQSPLDATLPISPPSTSPSIVDHFSGTTNTTTNNNTISTTTSGNNLAPLVDSDGYAIPSTTNNTAQVSSDVSSRNTFDDVDSFQSSKFSQRIQFNIKEDAVKEDTSTVNDSYTKMASMLRERTPTINRRARGRRDTITRSQTDTSLFNASPDSNSSPRVVSMIAVSSSSENSKNPFLKSPSFNTIYAIPESSPTRTSSMTNLSQNIFESPSSMQSSPTPSSSSNGKATPWQQLQSIPEVTNQPPASITSSPSLDQQQFLSTPQPSYITTSITETTNMTSTSPLHVSGRITLSYYGSTLPSSPSSTVIPLRLEHVSGIRQLEPNTNYITVENGEYMLHTDKMEENGEPIVAFTYEMDISSSALPIRLSPSWKCVEGTSYLIIKHQKSNIPTHTTDLTGQVCVDMSKDRVSQVQSTPQGIWDMNKHRLTWKLSDLMSQYSKDTGEEQQQKRPRLLAKFYLEGHSTPAPIYLNYRVKNASISGIEVVCDGLDIKQTERSVQSKEVVYIHTGQQ